MPTKQTPCKCAALPFPHKRNLNCDLLADDERIAQRDWEDERRMDERERARDMQSELTNHWEK